MNDSLDTLRLLIDKEDGTLLDSFIKRMGVSEKIAEYKAQNDMSIYVPEREKALLEKIASQTEPQYQDIAAAFFRTIMQLGKSVQFTSIGKDIYSTLIENAEKTTDQDRSLKKTAVFYTANNIDQKTLKDKFPDHIISFSDDSENFYGSIISGIYYHGILQVDDTEGIPADICEVLSMYGLYIVKDQSIEGKRFLLISKNIEILPDANKTSVLLVLTNTPNSLSELLLRLNVRGVNITKLEVKPIKNSKYSVYLEFRNPADSLSLGKLLSELSEMSEKLHYLGSY